MRAFDSSEPAIFIHVPKTAGNSVRDIVGSWFPDRMFLHYYNAQESSLPPRRDLTALSEHSGPPLIFGHFNKDRGFGVKDYYPEVRQFLTILREPLDMHVSRYFFVRRVRKTGKIYDDIGDKDLDSFVETGTLNMLQHFPCEITLETFRDTIDRSFIDIGCVETLGPSLKRMARRLGQPDKDIQIPRLNATERTASTTPRHREIFRDRYPLEYALWDHVYALNIEDSRDT